MPRSRHDNVGGVQLATRHCGNITIRCRFDDAQNQYACNLSRGGRKLGTQYVGLPGAWATLAEYRGGVDSPAAFDSAARAAISFQENEHGSLDGLAHNGSDYVVRRRK